MQSACGFPPFQCKLLDQWILFFNGFLLFIQLAFANYFLDLQLIHSNVLQLPCYSFKELEEHLRDAQSASQRLETQLVQKERLYEDKIKVGICLIMSRLLTVV